MYTEYSRVNIQIYFIWTDRIIRSKFKFHLNIRDLKIGYLGNWIFEFDCPSSNIQTKIELRFKSTGMKCESNLDRHCCLLYRAGPAEPRLFVSVAQSVSLPCIEHVSFRIFSSKYNEYYAQHVECSEYSAVHGVHRGERA